MEGSLRPHFQLTPLPKAPSRKIMLFHPKAHVFWVSDPKLQICHPKALHFGFLDQKWQRCLKNIYLQISIQINEKKNQFFCDFVTERPYLQHRWVVNTSHLLH